jgi:ribosomal protein S14
MRRCRYFKDSTKRNFYKTAEIFQRVSKVIILYTNKLPIKLLTKKKSFKNSIFKSEIKNYCVVSGRPRSIYRKLKISRIVLRFLGGNGLFFGFKKAS